MNIKNKIGVGFDSRYIYHFGPVDLF